MPSKAEKPKIDEKKTSEQEPRSGRFVTTSSQTKSRASSTPAARKAPNVGNMQKLSHCDRPIWEVIQEISSRVSDREWKTVPTDSAINVDYYLYGSPKKEHPVAEAELTLSSNVGRFELKTAKNGKFLFNLKAGNGPIILSSEPYDTRKAAASGIEAIKRSISERRRYVRVSNRGEYHFNLKAANGEIIGESRSYRSAEDMEKDIRSLENVSHFDIEGN